MFEERIDCVKKEIRSVLISSKDGLSLRDFCKTYKSLLGTQLPTREFGYATDIDFLYSLRDVVHIQVERNGSYQLHGIADKTTEHIQRLVSKQKQPKANPSKKSSISFVNVARSYRNMPTDTRRLRPFIPALLRSEIVEIVKQYPDGISYLSLLQAYQSFYKKELNLEWLSSDPEEKFKKLVNAVPELDLKLVHNQLKLHYLRIDNEVEDVAYNHRPSKAVAKVAPILKSIEIEHNQKVLEGSLVPKDVKSNCIKVLKQYPKGILAVHFPIQYENVTKLPLDLHDMGFSSLLELVDALPEIFSSYNVPESSKDWILCHPDFSKQISSSLKLTSHTPGVPPVKSSSSRYLKENLPSDIAQTSLPYVYKDLPNDKEKYFPVYVSSVVNPSLFWIQLQTEEAILNLEKLEKEMKYFYKQHGDCYQLSDSDILIGSSCVAYSASDSNWYRASIISLPTVDYVNVSFVDYGGIEKVHRSNLFYLKDAFIDLPAHAHKSTLASIKPKNQAFKWCSKAQVRFLELCNKPSLMAKVDSLDNGLFSLLLCDTSGDKTIYLNDVLVNEDYALFCLPVKHFKPNFTNNPYDEDDAEISSSNTYAKQIVQVESNISDSRTSNDFYISSVNKNAQPKRLFVEGKEKKLVSEKRRYVKKVPLGDGYKINIIVVANKPYVSGGDLCNLIWADKHAEVLALRLKFKDIDIPSISITQNDYEDLFFQCKSYSVRDFQDDEKETSVVLYPLEYALKILNIFGHHSSIVRETICKEVSSFDACDAFWNEFQEPEKDEDEYVSPSKNVFNRLCVYDLKAVYEGLRFKRLKLIKESQGNDNDFEISKIDSFQKKIMKQIDAINAISSRYTT